MSTTTDSISTTSSISTVSSTIGSTISSTINSIISTTQTTTTTTTEALLTSLHNDTTQALDKFNFGTIDYILFIMVFIMSAGIGVYFGFFSKSKNTTDEYLLGSKKMKAIPIAISLIASQLSALAIMSVPAESYSFGFTYLFMGISIIFVMPILCHIIVPVFYKNNISNCYEYLELRFNKATRRLVTVCFILNATLMIPIFMFIPSLAFSQVTGKNIHLINLIATSICVFYTMLGGIKAVVWTDVLQSGIMLSSVILVGILGIAKVGGFNKVLELADEGGRLGIDFSWDPRVRITFWNAVVGGVFMWTGHIGLHQSCVQRIVSLPSIHHARRALYIACAGILIVVGFNSFTGIVMYAYYHGCDPLATGHVSKPDKMVPFFVQDIMGNLKGMPGVFISCVFSAALSTMSAVLNSLAGVVYFDYIRPFIKHTDARANYIMKIFVIVMGIYSVFGGFVVQNFNSIMQLIITTTGITTGSVVAVFLLGMFVPRVSGKVAVTSVAISISTMIWIVLMGQMKIREGIIRYDILPTRTDQCAARGFHSVLSSFTTTMATPLNHTTEIPRVTTSFDSNRDFSIFEVSFYWYKFMGTAIVWLVAIPLSYVWKRDDDEKWDPKLYSPFVKKLIRHKTRQMEAMPLNTQISEDYIINGDAKLTITDKEKQFEK